MSEFAHGERVQVAPGWCTATPTGSMLVPGERGVVLASPRVWSMVFADCYAVRWDRAGTLFTPPHALAPVSAHERAAFAARE